MGVLEEKESLGRESTFREDLRAEPEESSLLEFVTTKRMVKAQQTGKS
jgi:hypothetical protein